MKKSAIILTALFLMPVTVFAGGQAEESEALKPSDGIVEYLEGDVFIDGEAADFGMKVPYGSVIETGVGSYCEVVFNSKNIFRIMESTIATVKIEEKSSEVEISKGAFAALFTKIEAFTSDEPFKIKTQTTLAGVRGTAFFVKVEDSDSTYVCICNGELELSEPDGSNFSSVSAGHHKASRYKNIDGKIVVTNAPLLYHSDDDMNELASHINESIPWDDSGYSTGY